MTDNVVPIRAVEKTPPVYTVDLQLQVMPNGDTVPVIITGPPMLNDAELGNMLLRATYWHHRHKLKGFAVAALCAGETNVYNDPSIPWTGLYRWRLRQRFDDLYFALTGRRRGLFHWPFARRQHADHSP